MRVLRVLTLVFAVFLLGCPVQASWYWPFGSSDGSGTPRLSELVEPASLLIDEAADLAAEGKIDESVEKYRKALEELDRIEMENPERAKTAEFATIRNKRAYVNAAIDSMLLNQIKANAKTVAVSDTRELEKKLATEKNAKKNGAALAKEKPAMKETSADEGRAVPEPVAPPTRREQAMEDIARGDFAAAELIIADMLAANPKSAMALNLKAALECGRGDLKEAESILDQAIASNPRSHFAYYNMAYLMLQKNPEAKATAKRYYETGLAMGGPADPTLEALLK